ncbi:MAG: zinc metalloprotease, partial [Cytophagaceae bacterium]
MRKITLPIVCMALIGAVSSCFDPNVDQSSSATNQNARQGNDPRACATMDVLAENIKENPSIANKLAEIDKHAERFSQRNGRAAATAYTGVVTIPVRVHVIYNTNKLQENISQAQIQSQIDVLNKDFRKANSDISLVPGAFSGLASDMQIQFTLAGIDRTKSSKTSWGTRDAMKSSKKGGVDPIDP